MGYDVYIVRMHDQYDDSRTHRSGYWPNRQ